jgi:hypothetical protein
MGQQAYPQDLTPHILPRSVKLVSWNPGKVAAQY